MVGDVFQDREIRLWDLAAGADARPLYLRRSASWHAAAVAAHPLGDWIVASTSKLTRLTFWPLRRPYTRILEGYSTVQRPLAFSPDSKWVATAFYYGQGEKTLRVWDLESRTMKRFDLPTGQVPANEGTDAKQAPTGYERGVGDMAFADESTLYSAGDGGLRRWNLDTGTQELLVAAPPGVRGTNAQFSRDRRLALLTYWHPSPEKRPPVRVYDIRAGTSGELPRAFGEPKWTECSALDPSGRVVATGSTDGIVRVGRLDRAEPHILAGHKGAVRSVDISPDLRWVATTGEDNTLRLWPMPDLSKAPLHTLPLDQLLAKLRSLTNLRAVRDPASSTGWKIEVGPFPGWKVVPTW
jgi:WD40 repeat protein